VEAATVIEPASPYQEFARFYDRVMGDTVAPLIESSFEQSRRRYGIRFASAADIGCGTGRLLLHLSSHCTVLYGVDSSAEMLDEARRRTEDKNIQFLRQDLQELRLPRPVDLITCTFDTLNYLTTPGRLRRALQRIRYNLRDGGHVVFDLITGAGERGRRRFIRQRVRLRDADATWAVAIDGRRSLSRVDMQWLSRGNDGRLRRWREVHLQRWYPLPWLCALLARCGLSVRGIHDAVSYEPASARTWWAHFVACKLP
jgi:SAM-dependent methyltransferase